MSRMFALSCAAALVFVSASLPAAAEVIGLGAELAGKNEIPSNTSTASGMADVSYDEATGVLTWKVTFSGLSGPVIGAHIHGPAPANGNAGVMIGFATGESPIEGSVKIDEAKAKALLNGQTYVNIHTQAHPGGEVRGHLTKK